MSDEIRFPATSLVHWPGKSTAACDKHTADLQALNNFMGGPLLARTALKEPAECANCVNENKGNNDE